MPGAFGPQDTQAFPSRTERDLGCCPCYVTVHSETARAPRFRLPGVAGKDPQWPCALVSDVRALLTRVSVVRPHQRTHPSAHLASLVPGPFPPPASRARGEAGVPLARKGCTCPSGLFSPGVTLVSLRAYSWLCCSGVTPGGLTGPSVVPGTDPGQLCVDSDHTLCLLLGGVHAEAVSVCGWTAQRLAGPALHRLFLCSPRPPLPGPLKSSTARSRAAGCPQEGPSSVAPGRCCLTSTDTAVAAYFGVYPTCMGGLGVSAGPCFISAQPAPLIRVPTAPVHSQTLSCQEVAGRKEPQGRAWPLNGRSRVMGLRLSSRAAGAVSAELAGRKPACCPLLP